MGPAVYSVDRTFAGWNGAYRRNVFRVGQFHNLAIPLECDSALLDQHYPGEPLSLAFIDGWHSFQAVLRDFEMVNRWLVPGGYVAFHDVAPQPYQPGQINAFYQEALHHREEWLAEELEMWSGSGREGEYHLSESRQDFRIDEAVAVILHEHSFELVDIPVLDGSHHLDRVREYRRGTTSPYHGLVALRKTT